jgi:hypothetical protein
MVTKVVSVGVGEVGVSRGEESTGDCLEDQALAFMTDVAQVLWELLGKQRSGGLVSN